MKIQRKAKHEVGRGMLPHADKSTLPVATAPQQIASPGRSAAGNKHPGFNTPQIKMGPVKAANFADTSVGRSKGIILQAVHRPNLMMQ